MRDALEPTDDPGWVLHEDGYYMLCESSVESRFAIGNGFLGVRASRAVSRGPTWLAWLPNPAWASWPRTYVAGLFDRPNTDPPVPALVPVGDWLRVRILLNGEPLLLHQGTVLRHRRTLDMRRGTLLAVWRQRAPSGVVAQVRTLRLVSQHDRALGLQFCRVELDRDGIDVTLDAWLEGAGMGMDTARAEAGLGVWHTTGARRSVAIAAAATLRVGGDARAPDAAGTLRWTWRWRSVAGQTAALERLVAVARGDTADADPAAAATAALARAQAAGGEAVRTRTNRPGPGAGTPATWRSRATRELQRALRFAIYHLNSAANPDDPRVSIGARGLTGDGYLGHVFWDTEIYLLPFYIATWPEAARTLLMYRYRTLDGARAKAAHGGWRGALYAWESADTGEETTPERVIGPDGTPVEVMSGRQEQHIAADVAYAVWQYWRATGDDGFLLEAGAEILLETARFWASRPTLKPTASGISAA